MTRPALLALALLLLAGCSTPTPFEQNPAAFRIADVPWPWCTEDKLYLCAPLVLDNGEFGVLQHGGRIGDEAAVFDTIGTIVDAFSEVE